MQWQTVYASNCYNTGAITSTTGYAGGITGYLLVGTIINGYNAGVVTAISNKGGILGYKGSGSGTNNFYLSTTASSDALSASALSASSMKAQSSFTNWDFFGETTNGTSDLWKISEGSSYPYLSNATPTTLPGN